MNPIGYVSPSFTLNERKSIFRNVVIFKVLRFSGLLKKLVMDEVQNKESGNIQPT
jgi:hypothetical protein